MKGTQIPMANFLKKMIENDKKELRRLEKQGILLFMLMEKLEVLIL
ncbi:hypothetical protein L3D_27400 [Enterococcus faecalis]|nr:hypothetical protein L3D_27400 [Enterococcus faecalis]